MERILQHRKPSDVQFGVKDYLKDEWSRIPVNQKCSEATCLVCGLPTMRFVYQQQETYTAICMRIAIMQIVWMTLYIDT